MKLFEKKEKVKTTKEPINVKVKFTAAYSWDARDEIEKQIDAELCANDYNYCNKLTDDKRKEMVEIRVKTLTEEDIAGYIENIYSDELLLECILDASEDAEFEILFPKPIKSIVENITGDKG